jgi:UDP-N-acetylglucosamine acyltransferase
MQIHPTAVIDPGAELGSGVIVGPYAIINSDVIVGDHTEIMAHAHIDRFARIGSGCRIFPMASVGTEAQDLKYEGGKSETIIGDNVTLREFVTINRATSPGGQTKIGDGCLIMAYAHVAHECHVGNNVIMANYCALAGHVTIEDEVNLSGYVGIQQFLRVGRFAFVGQSSRVNKDVPPYLLGQGTEAFKLRGPNSIGLKRKGFSSDTIRALKEAFRLIFRNQRPLAEVLEEATAEFSDVPEVLGLVEFIRASKRGVYR